MKEMPKARQDALKRIRIIKGHMAGIERMIEENKNCDEVLVQVAAIRSSLNNLAAYLLEHNALVCLSEEEDCENRADELHKIVKQMVKFLK